MKQGRIRHALAALVAATAIAGAAPAIAADHPAAPIATASKSCSSGFTHAVINGAQKCLRRGEFCSSRYRRQYPRYGFRCIAGRLR
jgi:hypothetical protein